MDTTHTCTDPRDYEHRNPHHFPERHPAGTHRRKKYPKKRYATVWKQSAAPAKDCSLSSIPTANSHISLLPNRPYSTSKASSAAWWAGTPSVSRYPRNFPCLHRSQRPDTSCRREPHFTSHHQPAEECHAGF